MGNSTVDTTSTQTIVLSETITQTSWETSTSQLTVQMTVNSTILRSTTVTTYTGTTKTSTLTITPTSTATASAAVQFSTDPQWFYIVDPVTGYKWSQNSGSISIYLTKGTPNYQYQLQGDGVLRSSSSDTFTGSTFMQLNTGTRCGLAADASLICRDTQGLRISFYVYSGGSLSTSVPAGGKETIFKAVPVNC